MTGPKTGGRSMASSKFTITSRLGQWKSLLGRCVSLRFLAQV